jgi:large subunit ribosomal protein L9
LAAARRVAEQERVRERGLLKALVQRLEGVEVTVRARANEEGVLYGSVGSREVAAALADEGYPVMPDHVVLETPIRHLDNVSVDIKFADDLRSTVKVWVVREKTPEEEEAGISDETTAGREAGSNDNSTDIE